MADQWEGATDAAAAAGTSSSEAEGTDQEAPSSAEGTGTAEATMPEPRLEDLAAFVAQEVRRQVLTDLRPVLDQHFRGTQSQIDRMAATLNRELGGDRENLVEMKAYLEQLLPEEDRAQLQDKAALAKYQHRERQQQAETQRQPAAVPQGMTQQAWEQVFTDFVAPDLNHHAKLRGFSDADLSGPDWTARVLAAGAPAEIQDLSPRGIQAYKQQVYQAIDKLAQGRGQITPKPRTRVETVRPAGGTAGLNPNGYRETLKQGGSLPSAADIDQMVARNFSLEG